MVQRVSDPSSGVAHPVFFPAGRLDPVATLTRGIDMYLIGPFPRPQFFGGPRPQLLAVPRPQFSSEGCYLPANRSSDTGGAPRRANASSSTTRLPAVDRNDESAAINTGVHTTSSSPASRSRTANRRPAAHRPDPAQRPGRSRTRHNGPLDGRDEPEPTHRVPRTHRAARPSRAPHRRRPGSLPKSTQPRHDIHRTAVRPSCRETSTGERTDTNGIQRPHFNDSKHHRKAHGRPTTSGLRSGHPAGHSSSAQTNRHRGDPQRRTARCGAAERPGSSTIGTRRRDEKPPPRSRRDVRRTAARGLMCKARRPLAHLRRTDAERARGIIGRGGEQSAQMHEHLRQDLAATEIEATAGGGMVTVAMNGLKHVLAITIDPEIIPQGRRRVSAGPHRRRG